jgi:uncharacterized membrane protein YkvA (DUF1232 family)
MMKSAYFPLEFLRRTSHRRRSAANGIASISEYVEQEATLLKLEDLEELRSALTDVRLQITSMKAPQFPDLEQQLKLLVDFFADTTDGIFLNGSEASRKETAFALRYAAKEKDIIPDFVPEIGYADDALIVGTVLSRHRDVFGDYCRFREIDWSELFQVPIGC